MPPMDNATEQKDIQMPLETEEPQTGEVFAQARDLGLRTKQGCPYAGMTCTVRKGELTALRGRDGSGKTALLLTLAARMAHNQGELTILGQAMPKGARRVQRRIGLGLFEGLNDPRSNLTVAATVAAELSLFGKPSKRDDVEAYLCEWGIEDISRMSVGDLPRERLVLLGIVLGMAGNPEALAVDDVETGLTARQSARLMDHLHRIAHERGIAVMVACADSDLAQAADRIYELS